MLQECAHGEYADALMTIIT